jgi:hypothetical protein
MVEIREDVEVTAVRAELTGQKNQRGGMKDERAAITAED